MDFLQFINHIQKKITGKNRVHGIGQGHNSSLNNGPDANGTAPLGYFNADMVDGLHARGEGVNLNSAYIPVANGNEPNPNLNAEALFKVVSSENHWLKLDTTTKGSISRIKDDELVWNIAHYEPFTPIPLKDGTQPGTASEANSNSGTVKIEPSHPDNQAIFYGSALGIRGWGADNAHTNNHSQRGAIYVGAVQAGGIGIWTSSNTNGYVGRLINPDGTIEGSIIRDGSIPTSKLLGYLDNLTISATNILDGAVDYSKLEQNLKNHYDRLDNLYWASVVVATPTTDTDYTYSFPAAPGGKKLVILSLLFIGGKAELAGQYWTPERNESDGYAVLASSSETTLTFESATIGQSSGSGASYVPMNLRISYLYTFIPA